MQTASRCILLFLIFFSVISAQTAQAYSLYLTFKTQARYLKPKVAERIATPEHKEEGTSLSLMNYLV
jgi:hypothetical protein